MLKHIIRMCKVENYVDKDTSSGTQISSRRRNSRSTPARLQKELDTQNLNIVVAALITRTDEAAFEVDQSSRSGTDLHWREQVGL